MKTYDPNSGEVATIDQLVRSVRCILEKAGIDAREQSRYLVCDVLNIPLTALLANGRAPIAPVACADIIQKAHRVASGEPLQYATGKAYFCGNTFSVDTSTLIPRPETEQLVDWVCESSPRGSLLDIGTGSGCIAISLKIKLPHLYVEGTDISADALRVATRNADRLEAAIDFRQFDILSDVAYGNTFDTVVSNPPYVMDSERATMLPIVLDHEPHTALFVPDTDPLLFYRAIANRCLNGMLAKGGQLFFEINEAMGNATKEMLAQMGFTQIEIRSDIYGKERMARAVME